MIHTAFSSSVIRSDENESFFFHGLGSEWARAFVCLSFFYIFFVFGYVLPDLADHDQLLSPH